ncbi:MAG: hypothetical protein QM765_29225 [Myxococcales bacterium]
MNYFAMTWHGHEVKNLPTSEFPKLLDSLADADDEHPDVWIRSETGWGLSAFRSGLLVWENVEDDGPPRHMKDVPPARVLELWKLLAEGRFDRIDQEPWLPGYGA